MFPPGRDILRLSSDFRNVWGEMNGNKNSGSIITAIVMIKHKNNNNNGK